MVISAIITEIVIFTANSTSKTGDGNGIIIISIIPITPKATKTSAFMEKLPLFFSTDNHPFN